MATTILAPSRATPRTAKALVLGALFAIALFFVGRYVFHYYLHYDAENFGDFWPHRFTLLLHITGGMLALLVGPWQFSTGLRRRSLRVHRLLGRVYLIAVAAASLASFRLALTTTEGWAWGFALMMLGVAWITTSGMAYYAVMKRRIPVHKEWMVRSYVVTFAFVLFRFLDHTSPLSHLHPARDRALTCLWSCWTLPLLATEVILQLRRMRTKSV